MENKTWIIILSILLTLSLSIIILLSYAIVGIDTKWEDTYNKNDMEWCIASKLGNEIINDFIDELAYYDEEYADMPYIEELDCFS